MSDLSRHTAYPATRPAWPVSTLIPALILVPWVAINRGVHRWPWPAAVATHLIGLATLPLWWLPDAPAFDQTRTIYLLVLFELITVALAGGLQSFVHLDGKSLHTYRLAILRLWLATPFVTLAIWLLTGWGYLLAELGDRASAASLGAVVLLVGVTLTGSFFLMIVALIAVVHAARPGWSCRWPAGCEACNYALLGLAPDANCPECGRPIATSLAGSAREGVEAAASTRWRRGWMTLLRPSDLGRYVTVRGPEPFPIVAWTLAFLAVWLICLYGMLVIQRAFTLQMIGDEPTIGMLMEVLLLVDGPFPGQRLQLLTGVSIFAWLYAAALMLLINFAALVAERAGGNRGFAPVRQAIHQLQPHWFLAILVAVILTLWYSLGQVFVWLNPFAVLLRSVERLGWTAPESLHDLVAWLPLIVLVLWSLGMFAWFTYALSRVARAARYANW
jgi:hypothetical protein